jgi:glucokinase
MSKQQILGIDIGGSKLAWGIVSTDGVIGKSDVLPTPTDKEALLQILSDLATEHSVVAIGIGMAGIMSPDHRDVVVSPNLPSLSHFEIVRVLEEKTGLPVSLENDARCALVGEAWKGAATETSSVVLVTIGTGIGGAVMQRHNVLPHPSDLSCEIGRIIAMPDDYFPAPSGRGTIEALLGGKNLESRFGITMSELVSQVKKGEAEALELFETISYYFTESMRAIFDTYSCKLLVIGGKGALDLDLYYRTELPCPVVPASLGEQAGIVGAARIALDLYEKIEADKAGYERNLGVE